MAFFASKIATLKRTVAVINDQPRVLDELRINQGIMLAGFNRQKDSKNIQDYEFKVFSQWGEDGILQYLTSVLEIPNKTFIEFGVEDFFESNCRFLLVKDNWRGFVLDSSPEHINRLRSSYFFWKYDLRAESTFITRENINELLAQSCFDQDLGILSIDIDGNDYHVLEAIAGFRPRILVCEYNAVFGPERRIVVPYDPRFSRGTVHSSNLYYGASLGALVFLTRRLGYSLVGTNSAGNNGFFVRNDLVTGKLLALDAETGFTPSRFRESRDSKGSLSYVSGEARLTLIQGLPVLNVETNCTEKL
jgi:hypothetical protein